MERHCSSITSSLASDARDKLLDQIDSRDLIAGMDEMVLFEQWRQERLAAIQQEVQRRSCGVPFGERMRVLRQVLGLTQKQLAASLRVSVRTVIRHEMGRSVRAWSHLVLGLRELELSHAHEFFNTNGCSPRK